MGDRFPTLEKSIERNGRAGVRLAVPYRRRFAEELKNVVPRGERAFESERESWWIAKAFELRALNAAFQFFPEVLVVVHAGAGWGDWRG